MDETTPERPYLGGAPLDHPRRCTARRQGDGQHCRRYAARGATVCRTHGGAAPQVQAAAKRRLQQATEALAMKLLGIALDEGASESVRLQAIRDALDRGGVTAKTAVEVDVAVGPTPEWQAAMANVVGIDRISKAESRARRGLPPDRLALPPAEQAEPLDAEVVDVPGEPPPAPKSRPPWQDEPPPTRPSTALMTAEQAATETAAIRAQQRASIGRVKRVSSRRV